MFLHRYTKSRVNQEERFETIEKAMWNAFLCSTLDGLSVGEIVDEAQGKKYTYDDIRDFWLENEWREGLASRLAALQKFGK